MGWWALVRLPNSSKWVGEPDKVGANRASAQIVSSKLSKEEETDPDGSHSAAANL